MVFFWEIACVLKKISILKNFVSELLYVSEKNKNLNMCLYLKNDLALYLKEKKNTLLYLYLKNPRLSVSLSEII